MPIPVPPYKEKEFRAFCTEKKRCGEGVNFTCFLYSFSQTTLSDTNWVYIWALFMETQWRALPLGIWQCPRLASWLDMVLNRTGNHNQQQEDEPRRIHTSCCQLWQWKSPAFNWVQMTKLTYYLVLWGRWLKQSPDFMYLLQVEGHGEFLGRSPCSTCERLLTYIHHLSAAKYNEKVQKAGSKK